MPGPLNPIDATGVFKSANHAGNPKPAGRQENLAHACRDFESLFVQYVLKEMRKTVPENGLFSGGRAEQIYSSMLDGEMAKEISRQGGIGLATVIQAQMAGRLNEKK